MPVNDSITESSEQLLTFLNMSNSDPSEVNKLSVPVNDTISTSSEQLSTCVQILKNTHN